MAPPTVPKVQAQRQLALLWFLISGLATAILGIRTHGADDEAEFWKWLSPYVFPLLLLMIGTLRADETTEDVARSSRFYFRLCWATLVFYGVFLLGALYTGLNTPATDANPHAMLESLQQSGLLLTAVQSVLTLALGAFFVTTTPAAKGPAPPGPAGKPA